MSVEDPADIARRLIRENLYLTLATADAAGSPWVSPVFYVAAEDEHFYWVSSPEARHSRNLAERAEVSMVIFDSRVRVGEAQAVYISGRAGEVSGAAIEQSVQVYSRGSELRGAAEWTVEHVRAPAVHRLYRATATAFSVLDSIGHSRPGDQRIEVLLSCGGGRLSP
jgi:nitroimidazol reductase NimA-like FMN-containing flavoprotein (pyridoxamine 5'-phosphate oxidase superfamily)